MFTIVRSKLRPPGIPRDAAERVPLLLRLSTAVERPASQGAVVFITTGPGYGKSTLLAAWGARLSAQGTPVAWYNLSPGDRALPVFLGYLEAGLRAALPGFVPGCGAPRDLAGGTDAPDAADDAVTVEGLVTPILAGLEQALSGGLPTYQPPQRAPRLLLVLEDLQHVAGHPAIDTALAFLLRHLPAGLVVAISSRSDPGSGLPLARLRRQQQVIHCEDADLRLSPNEVERAFPQVTRANGQRPAIARLVQKLDGWAMGYHVLEDLLHEERGPAAAADPSGKQLARRATEELYTYFDEEVLATAGEPASTFLLRTAILGDITVSTADAITEGSGSEGPIAQALRGHLFMRRIQMEPPAYRYHELFCEFLQARLGERFGHDEQRRLHRMAAALYAGTGDWTESARQSLAAGDVDAALSAVNIQREQGGEPERPPAGHQDRMAEGIDSLGYALRNTGPAPERWRLIDLLGRQAGAADIPLLQAFTTDEDRRVRDQAQTALEDLIRRTGGTLRITMFGGLSVSRGTTRVEEREWRRKRAKLLLAYLLLAGPEGASRQTIAEKVWPDALPGDANDQFYAHLRALRAVLEPGLAKGGDSVHIKNQQGRYAFAFDSPHHWDLAEYQRYRDQGRRAERLGRLEEATTAYERALTLYAGDLLPEPPFNNVTWLYHLRLGCRDDMVAMRAFLAEQAAAAENWGPALAHWKAILAVEPAREAVHARMMTVYAWLGRRDEALAQFQICRAALRRELHVEPLAGTVDLYQQILNQPSSAGPAH